MDPVRLLFGFILQFFCPTSNHRGGDRTGCRLTQGKFPSASTKRIVEKSFQCLPSTAQLRWWRHGTESRSGHGRHLTKGSRSFVWEKKKAIPPLAGKNDLGPPRDSLYVFCGLRSRMTLCICFLLPQSICATTISGEKFYARCSPYLTSNGTNTANLSSSHY